jgi:Na+-transporting NADH:ubiquinone oxidoreductase subunit NqrC
VTSWSKNSVAAFVDALSGALLGTKVVYDLFYGVLSKKAQFLTGVKNLELFSDVLGTSSEAVAAAQLLVGC